MIEQRGSVSPISIASAHASVVERPVPHPRASHGPALSAARLAEVAAADPAEPVEPRRLSTRDPWFKGAFQDLLDGARDTIASVEGEVAAILAAVRAEGDQAVARYTSRFDKLDLAAAQFRIRDDEIEAACAQVPPVTYDALRLAASRIEAFHRRQLPEDLAWTDDAGIGLGLRWTPLDSVGVYVPGGTASYPSSVLMNAIPARVAGVDRIAMVVPTPKGKLNPLVLAAARLAGVTEIFRIGGAQAIGALAFGTASIAPVDRVVGPGNAWVAAAKRQVFGQVGIDMIAGPSEVVILADPGCPADWIAADLLAQAEHDGSAQSILLTTDARYATEVAAAVRRTLATLPRGAIATRSWNHNGAIILVRSWEEAASLVDQLAPEHLQLALDEPLAETVLSRIRHAGAVFVGYHAPEAVGDYVAGPNHVLPTGRTARFASGLSVFDFLKRTTVVRCSGPGLAAIGPAAATLADAEGLGAHALSVRVRLAGRSLG